MAEISTKITHAVCATLRVVDGTSEVLLLKRANTPKNIWWLVAGSVEANEPVWQTAIRELAEETGLSPIEFYNADILEMIYLAALDRIVLAPVFLAYVAPDVQVSINEESLDYGWFTLAEAIERVSFPGQKRIMRQISDHYSHAKPDPFLRIQ